MQEKAKAQNASRPKLERVSDLPIEYRMVRKPKAETGVSGS